MIIMKIAVAIVHGIGNQDKTYADKFINQLRQTYQKISGMDNLVFESVCWQEEIEPIENTLYEKTTDLGWSAIRKFLIGYAGDALCYQSAPNDSYGFYDQVHEAVDRGLIRLFDKVEIDTPLCIVSHSLGTIVASNFIWDCQNKSKRCFKASSQASDMINRLELLYTMGSPLAIWSMRFLNGGEPISIPDCSLWYNLYSKNDVISSPIKLINQQYECMPNLFDVKVNVGGVLCNWNPASHLFYWDSLNVIRHIANNLKKVNDYWRIRCLH